MPIPQTPTSSLTSASLAAEHDYRVFVPSFDLLARVWRDVEPILKRATDRSGSFEPIDLLSLALVGRMVIWLVVTEEDRIVAAVAGEVKQHPRNRVLDLLFIGGTGLKYWHRQLLQAFEDHAHATGCNSIMTYGRGGWAHFGFKEIGSILERRVSIPDKVN